MGRFGFSEILLIMVVALLFFGGGKIADLGKGLGEGIRNFKKGLRDEDEPEKLPEGADAPKEKLTAGKKEGDAA
jgi:sec-independent protein translocase protein TatA